MPIAGPCPRCGSHEFDRSFSEESYCWWCSQRAMTATCGGRGGCGLRVCKPCLELKLAKPGPDQNLSFDATAEDDFSI
jgi:hypothetical protein